MNNVVNTQEALTDIREVLNHLRSQLPEKIEAASLTLKSKMPFKVLSLRELLLHRTVSLSDAAVEQFERSNFVPGIVLTRSVMETVAVAFQLERNLNKFLRTASMEVLDKFVMRALMASRNPKAKYEAPDITSFVDSVDKRLDGFRSVYNDLSEYVHPNWSGLLGSFGRLEPETYTLHLGQVSGGGSIGRGIGALAGTIGEFAQIYNSLSQLVREINLHFEIGGGRAE